MRRTRRAKTPCSSPCCGRSSAPTNTTRSETISRRRSASSSGRTASRRWWTGSPASRRSSAFTSSPSSLRKRRRDDEPGRRRGAGSEGSAGAARSGVRLAAGLRRGIRSFLVQVLEDGVNLPPVSVGILDPELLLPRVAAGLALHVTRREAAAGESGLPPPHFLGRVHPDPQVRERPRAGQPARLEREVDLGIVSDELDVIRLDLLRLAEEAPVEIRRPREIRNVEGDVDR